MKYSGEENAGGIAALGKAIMLLRRIGFNVIRQEEQFQRPIVLLVPSLKLQGFARVSFCIENTEADVDVLISELKKIAGGKHSGVTSSFSHDKDLTLHDTKEVQRQINNKIREISNKVYGEPSL